MRLGKIRAELSVEDCVCEATEKDLVDRLKSHYEYVSSISHEWSNQVGKAIDFYCKNKNRINELEAENKQFEESLAYKDGRILELEQKVSKLRACVEFFADKNNWRGFKMSGACEMARKTLAEIDKNA